MKFWKHAINFLLLELIHVLKGEEDLFRKEIQGESDSSTSSPTIHLFLFIFLSLFSLDILDSMLEKPPNCMNSWWHNVKSMRIVLPFLATHLPSVWPFNPIYLNHQSFLSKPLAIYIYIILWFLNYILIHFLRTKFNLFWI